MFKFNAKKYLYTLRFYIIYNHRSPYQNYYLISNTAPKKELTKS